MYGQCGKLIAQPGKRAELTAILLRAAAMVGGMPGCRVYMVNEDIADDTAVWVYEVWDDKAAHDDSLRQESVRALIGEAMPLIGAPPDGAELRVIGGHGVQ